MEIRKKIKEEGAKMRSSIQKGTIGYISAAFGLVAGLAWNDAIKSLIESVFPSSGGTVFAKFGYAFAITIVAILIIRTLSRLSENKSEK